MSEDAARTGARYDPHLIALGASLVLGAVLRFVGLDRQGFWTDELYVVWEGRQPLDVLLNPQLHVQHPPGYRLLLHGWMGISLDEVWIRLVPAISGILLIWAVWALARLLWPGSLVAGDVAALLVATSPYMLQYSQDVTTYSWTTLWVTVSFVMLVEAWRWDRWWMWAGWAASMAVAMYSHYFAVYPLLVAAAGVIVAGLGRGAEGRGKLAHALLAMLGAGVLYAPWVMLLLAGGGKALGIYFFPLTIDTQPVRWLPSLLAGYAHPAFWQSGPGLWVAWAVVAGCGMWIAWTVYRRKVGASRWGLMVVGGWAVAAIVGPYLFLRVTSPPGSVDPVRFATMAVPALLVGLAGVAAMTSQGVRVALVAGWLVMAGWQWRGEYLSPPIQDWRGIMSVVRAGAAAGDVMLAFPAFHAGAAVAYYSVPPQVKGGWFVREGSDPAGAAFWFPVEWQWRGFLASDARRSVDWVGEVEARTRGAGRIWYLAGDGVDGTYPPGATAERTLGTLGWSAKQEWRASPLVLRLYERK